MRAYWHFQWSKQYAKDETFMTLYRILLVIGNYFSDKIRIFLYMSKPLNYKPRTPMLLSSIFVINMWNCIFQAFFYSFLFSYILSHTRMNGRVMQNITICCTTEFNFSITIFDIIYVILSGSMRFRSGYFKKKSL